MCVGRLGPPRDALRRDGMPEGGGLAGELREPRLFKSSNHTYIYIYIYILIIMIMITIIMIKQQSHYY